MRKHPERIRFLGIVLIIMILVTGCGEQEDALTLRQDPSSEITGGISPVPISGTPVPIQTQSPTPSATPTPPLTPDRSSITSWDYIRERGVGWNLGDSLESWKNGSGYDSFPDLETAWGNPKVTQELIDYVHGQGFDTIRIPVSWYYNSGRDENGSLIVGEKWMCRVKEVVEYALQNDMYVILNTMHDSRVLFRCGVTSQEEWKSICQDAQELWTQIAEAFLDYDQHLIFEGYNELDNVQQGWTYSEFAAQQMNELNQIFVTSVRAVGGDNADRLLMVPTLFDSTKTNITDAFVLPQDTVSDRLLVTVHCYEEEYDQELEWIFQSLEDFSKRVNAPIFIGEFGSRDDYFLPEWREAFTSNYIARAAEHGIKCCIWDDGYHWKLIDRYCFDNSDQKIIRALFAGLEGQAYQTSEDQKIVYDSMEGLEFAAMNLGSGNIMPVDYVNKFWAALTTTGTDTLRMPLLGQDTITITMIAKNEAVDFWIYGITFFDQAEQPIGYVTGKNVTHKFLAADIPENAVYYAVNVFDPYHNHTREEVENYFEKGDLRICIFFPDRSKDQLHETSVSIDR